MAVTVIVDASFLVALLYRRDRHHGWAAAQASQQRPPWHTCEAALSETFYLLGSVDPEPLVSLLRRRMLLSSFVLADNMAAVLTLIEKYRQVPMSLADACLVRMTEIVDEALVLTTDMDFRIYRRHSRQIVPCVLPPERR
jgi:uncharacterized protein